jgi:sterol desaturase/sphingolipid hydroxylase (fatty acid hydroxylase superfamily)
MWWYAIAFVPIAVLLVVLGPWWLLAGYVAGLSFAVWWHVYLHAQYHLNGSPWSRFAWFRRKRELHFVHHRRVHTNYAIVEFWIDKLLGTYKEQRP